MFGVSLGSPIHLWVVKNRPMRHWRVEFACPATPPFTWKVACIHLFRFLLRSQMVAAICACFASNIMVKWELFCQASPHGPPTPPWRCLPSCSRRRLPGRLAAIRLFHLSLRRRIRCRLRHLRDEAIQRTMTRLSFLLLGGHLWPNLAEMRDTDKASFLDAPISQAGLFSDTVEDFAQQFLVVQKQKEAIKHILPWRDTAATRPPRGWSPVCSSSKASPCGVYICSGAGCYYTSACNVKLPQARAPGSR